MNLLELVYDCRLRADDISDTGTAPSGYSYYWEYSDRDLLWKNTELVFYLNQAHQEIALRTNYYRDYSPIDGLTVIDVIAGTATYRLDSRVITIEDVRLASNHASLTKWTLDDYRVLTNHYTDTGLPTHYSEAGSPFQIQLYPIPVIDDQLYLTIYRYPLADFSWDDRDRPLDEPRVFHREALIHGALALAYQKRDSDAVDLKSQVYHEAQFQKLVGPPVDYRTLETRRWNANLDISIRPSGYTRSMRSSSWSN